MSLFLNDQAITAPELPLNMMQKYQNEIKCKHLIVPLSRETIHVFNVNTKVGMKVLSVEVWL